MKRLGIFAYNFKHKKTYEGLLHLFTNGYQPECILAANPITINFYKSKLRETLKDIDYMHPEQLAERLNIPYYIVDHKSNDCIQLIKKHSLELGIILGARILPERIINSFEFGVLNMHPGLLPENRGLDNTKWAIINGMKQGVTTHLIDKFIDKGQLIDRKEINVYQDDSLVDILARLQNLELTMMIDYLNKVRNKKDIKYIKLLEGKRYQSVPWEIEKDIYSIFEDYKTNYKTLK
tara:strand:- start:503 stop:1210 length:708 start_codon:yes stop_codon:yes gene_type:complete